MSLELLFFNSRESVAFFILILCMDHTTNATSRLSLLGGRMNDARQRASIRSRKKRDQDSKRWSVQGKSRKNTKKKDEKEQQFQNQRPWNERFIFSDGESISTRNNKENNLNLRRSVPVPNDRRLALVVPKQDVGTSPIEDNTLEDALGVQKQTTKTAKELQADKQQQEMQMRKETLDEAVNM